MPIPIVKAVTMIVNTFHCNPRAAIEPITQNAATPTGAITTNAGVNLRVNNIKTKNETTINAQIEKSYIKNQQIPAENAYFMM